MASPSRDVRVRGQVNLCQRCWYGNVHNYAIISTCYDSMTCKKEAWQQRSVQLNRAVQSIYVYTKAACGRKVSMMRVQTRGTNTTCLTRVSDTGYRNLQTCSSWTCCSDFASLQTACPSVATTPIPPNDAHEALHARTTYVTCHKFAHSTASQDKSEHSTHKRIVCWPLANPVSRTQ